MEPKRSRNYVQIKKEKEKSGAIFSQAC